MVGQPQPVNGKPEIFKSYDLQGCNVCAHLTLLLNDKHMQCVTVRKVSSIQEDRIDHFDRCL